jgi:hypothetical protein
MVVTKEYIVKWLLDSAALPSPNLLSQSVEGEATMTTTPNLVTMNQQASIAADAIDCVPVPRASAIRYIPRQALLARKDLLADAIQHAVTIRLGIMLPSKVSGNRAMITNNSRDVDLLEVGKHPAYERTEDAWTINRYLPIQ